MDAVRAHTVHWIQVGPDASQIGFPHNLWKKPTPAIARHSLQDLPVKFSTHFRALSSVTIGSLRCSSQRCCLHALDRGILLPHPWLPSLSTGLLLSGPPVASQLPQPSFLCKHHIALPSLLLRCLYTTPGRRRASQHLQGRTPPLLCYVVDIVPTSSARSVNSSGLSLTVTTGPSSPFGLRTLKVTNPTLRCPTTTKAR